MDVLIRAGAGLLASFPDLTIVIGGVGRDSARLQRLIDSSAAPVRLLGRVEERSLPDLYGAADVFVMACRDRWHGLEQEGFGIVFLEAAACGVPQVAGRSGGAAEAVVDGETGIVVDDPDDPGEVAAALRKLLSDPELARSMGEAARRRVVESYDYDGLSLRLAAALRQVEG
jgi:phosphatidylinositol alpha-1,6-mannosyltransferase